ncbi:MAG TPA: hypothetical protein ACFYD3_00225 [Candidatus Hypogeohydataceae bacterium YC41]
MKNMLKEVEKGVILINKPVGITSFGVVARVRGKYFPGQKVGHTGTLDHMASGLLILLVGEATKGQGDFMKLPKEYEGEFALGLESDTYSADGRLRFYYLCHTSPPPANTNKDVACDLVSHVGRLTNVPDKSCLRQIRFGELARYTSIKSEEIETVFKRFLGELEQAVPPFSAVQVKGERLHKLARKGRPLPELPRRRIYVESLKLLDFKPFILVGASASGGHVPLPSPEDFLKKIAPRVMFRTCVSSGTYIRSLVVDIGKELGTGAILTQLTRTRIGPYKLSDAIELPIDIG